jgi:citrate synthase
VIDNRRGRRFELAIEDGAIRSADLLRPLDGLMLYDPGLTSTAACRSAITYIDGEAGVLQHRGYLIEDLCEHSTFLELAYLLIKGELPMAAEFDGWLHEIGTRNFVHENVKSFLEGFRYDAHPMAMLAASVGALGSFYPDAGEVHDEQARQRQVVRLLGKMPTLAAFSYRHLRGQPYVYPEDDLSYAGNLLSMMFRMSELRYEPDPATERALDALLMVHADHEQNASATAVRAVGSTNVNPYSAIAAGVAALSGPMRGGAAQGVLRMLRRIGTTDAVPDFLEQVKVGDERLMGFGHWVYKAYDPRARILRTRLEELYEARGRNPLVQIADELAARAFEDEYFTSRRLSPNLDLYSGLTYDAIGIPMPMFPVMFALARSAGWIAQWLEMVQDPEQMTVRPQQLYAGELGREYVPIGRRG